MTETHALHPLAPHTLPRYLAGPDGHDPLFTVVLVLLIVLLMVIGNFYLKLHAMPERMAHSQNHMQMQVIAVLAVLALFTHNNVFWVLALLLAVVRLPDFSTPMNSMADSLKQMANAPGAASTSDPAGAEPVDTGPAAVSADPISPALSEAEQTSQEGR